MRLTIPPPRPPCQVKHNPLTYRDSPLIIAALRQASATIQDALRDSTSHQRSLDHGNEMLRDLECLSSVRPNDASRMINGLIAAALNTETRGLAYFRFHERLGGEALLLRDPAQWRESCNFALPLTAANSDFLPEAQIACRPREASVFFVNGVFSTPQQSLEYLTHATRNYLSSSDFDRLQFYAAENPTEGARDLWEAVKQRLENDFSRFYRFLSFLEPMPDFMQDAYREAASAIDVEALVSSPTLQTHIRLYQRELLEGRKVILVPHSQGNLFANRAVASLSAEERQSVGIVSVANPDSAVEGGRPYTTLTNDLVIGAIPAALPANTFNGIFNFIDWSGHAFVESYLEEGTRSRARILSHIKNALDTLAEPTTDAGDGVITITLTWGDEPDVDLHVFEPDGTHVFYAAKNGISGFLDVDDVTSYGPEHYFVSCATLRAGIYTIGVNYYNGSAPETANVQIQAGLLSRNFSVHLPEAVGPGGNSNPVFIANIVVTGNDQGGFEFQVE